MKAGNWKAECLGRHRVRSNRLSSMASRVDWSSKGPAGRCCSCTPASASSRRRGARRLAKRARVIAPTIPASAAPSCPSARRTVDDLSYFYLDLLDQLDLDDVTVVGVSLGAWIAAEIAVKSTARMSRLVLANAVGIKVGDRETRDIVDIFAITESEFNELAYFDPEGRQRATTRRCPRPRCSAAARNREATARFAWSPYMHDPKLKGRLHRIRIPTLFLWGTHDRMPREAYGRAYCAAIPGARFETDRARRPFSPSRAAGGICRAACSPSRTLRIARERSDRRRAMRVYQFTEQPYSRRGTITPARCASTCPTASAIRRSRPICSTATTTNGCSRTSSASTSCSTSITRPRPACRRPWSSGSRCWRA